MFYYQSAALLERREEMGRDVNDDRRRALVRGKFKFLYQDDTEDIEATDKFNLAVVQNKLLGWKLSFSCEDNSEIKLLFRSS